MAAQAPGVPSLPGGPLSPLPIRQLPPALPVPRWLCNDQIDAGTRRWAVEGLAYLTFDADVKEEFVEDEAALKALFQLSQVAPGSAVAPDEGPAGFLGGLWPMELVAPGREGGQPE